MSERSSPLSEPRAQPVRERILDAAERLLGDHGLNGVSLRQISAAAGTRNHYAVQFHFGDLDGLIRAVIARRAPELEMGRAQLLAQYAGSAAPTVRQLLEVLYRPILERDRPGEAAVLAKFFLAVHTWPGGWEPLYAVYADQPVTRRALELITVGNAPIPPPITLRRTLYLGVAILASTVAARAAGESEEFYQAAVSDAFAMSAAALSAPADESLPMLNDAGRTVIV